MDDFAGTHPCDAVVDLFQRDAVRDEITRIKATATHHAQLTRDIFRRLAITTLRAGENLAEVQGQGVQGQFAIVRHDAEANTTACGGSEVEAFFQHGRQTGTVDDDIRFATEDFSSSLREV